SLGFQVHGSHPARARGSAVARRAAGGTSGPAGRGCVDYTVKDRVSDVTAYEPSVTATAADGPGDTRSAGTADIGAPAEVMRRGAAPCEEHGDRHTAQADATQRSSG